MFGLVWLYVKCLEMELCLQRLVFLCSIVRAGLTVEAFSCIIGSTNNGSMYSTMEKDLSTVEFYINQFNFPRTKFNRFFFRSNVLDFCHRISI